MTDPKQIRFEQYAKLRASKDISFSNEQMESQLSTLEGRTSFHQYLGNKYGDMGQFEEWEAEFFPEYSKKKDSGELAGGSSASSSATRPTPVAPGAEVVDQSAAARTLLESQGVFFSTPGRPTKAAKEITPTYLEGMDMGGMVRESTAMPVADQRAMFEPTRARNEQEEIKKHKEYLRSLPVESLSNPSSAFELLKSGENTKSLHDDPRTPDRVKGQLKAGAIGGAINTFSDEMSFLAEQIGDATLTRYSDAKAALIEIYESGDPNTTIGNRNGQQWLDDYEMLLQTEPALAEYDEMAQKVYALDQSYRDIKNVNPEYAKDIERKRNKQIMADVLFNQATVGPAGGTALASRAFVGEALGFMQGFAAFIGTVGNSYGSSSARWDWADRTADFAMQHLVPPVWLTEPSRTQRSVGTFTANIGEYQIDVDEKGRPKTVRDRFGDIIFNDEVRQRIIDQYESMPDKYDVRYKMHLAPAISVAAHGTMQILITSRFAGLGKSAAAAKGITAGVLTARYAGQNYLQALDEFGYQNAKVASQFAISTAALQSAISIYVNPLEIKLNPKFNISPKTLKRVARDLDAGKSADVALRNGFREYSGDMAKALLVYAKEVGKEGLEGIMEQAVDVAGRRVVRASTDILVEQNDSLMDFVDSMTSEMIGAMGGAGVAVSMQNSWQQEGMMIAYENRDRILPMVKKQHGEEAAVKLSEAMKAADKRIIGNRMTREEKQKIVIEEYNKAIKTDAEKAETTPTVEVEPAVQPEVQPQPAEVAPAVEAEVAPEVQAEQPSQPADIYQVLREEAQVLMLDPGAKLHTQGGIEFTVETVEGDNITVRNGDTGETKTKSKREIQEAIKQQTQDRLSKQFPSVDERRINGIRRALADVAMQQRPIEETTKAPAAPALPPAQETTAVTPATPTTVEPVVPAGAKVYTRQDIEQAEGIDGAEMGRLMDVVAEIAPDMQVQVFETNADMQAELGQSGNAFVSQDGKTIYISKESSSIDKIHEVMHPIVVAADMRSPGTTERFYGEIFSTMPENVRNEIEAFIAQEGYANMEESARQEEAVVEFLARLADGRYDESILRDQTLIGKITNFFSEIFQKLGLTNPPSDTESLKAFAAKVVSAVKAGETISFGDTTVSQPTQPAAQQQAEQAPPHRNEQERLEWIADNSNDPVEISEAYISSHKLDQEGPQIDYRDRLILDEKLHEMSEKDFGDYLDPNWIDRAARNKFIRPVANNLDTRVESVSDRYGFEITIEDVVDFVGRDMRGEVDRRKPGETSATTKALGARYGEVTGGRMTIQTARKNVREALKQIDKEYETYLTEQGQSEAELEAAYYQAIQDGRIPAPAADSTRGGAVEGVQEGAEGAQVKQDKTLVEYKGKRYYAVSTGVVNTDYDPSGEAILRASEDNEMMRDEGDLAWEYERRQREEETGLRGNYDLYPESAVDSDGNIDYDAGFVVDVPASQLSPLALKPRITEQDIVGVFDDAGYHGGNLKEKSDYLTRGYRGDQPFTGYYFFSNPSDAVSRGNRATGSPEVRVVDFSKYNLLKPTTEEYWDLKSGLKAIEKSFYDGIKVADAARRSSAISRLDSPFSGMQDIYNEIVSRQDHFTDLFKSWRDEINKSGKGERFETVILKELGYEGIDVRGLKETASYGSPDTSAEGSVIFDLKPETVYDPSLKPRITDDTLDPVYYRAKKWMREEMDQIPPPGTPPRTKADIVADAVGTYGVTPGQAETMYDVLFNAPDSKRMGIPAGFNSHRKGILGFFDKAAQMKKKEFNASQGMPIRVLQGIEKAKGEAASKVKFAIAAHGRIAHAISKLPKDESRRIRELADRFMDGTISDADVATIPLDIYVQLRQLRTTIDEMTNEIISHSNFSALREEILSSNVGSYVSRVFAIHLNAKYKPSKKAIEVFMNEYRKKHYDSIAAENPTLSGVALEEMIALQGRRAYKDLLTKHTEKKASVKGYRMKKPTGQMKERMQFPGRASKLADDKAEGKYTGIGIPIDRGRDVNTGDAEFDTSFAQAWDDVRADRMREAYHKHSEHRKQYADLAKKGEKAMALAAKMGLRVPGTNPLSKESLRDSVEGGGPIKMSAVPATSADAVAYNNLVNEIQAGVNEIRQAVNDKVQTDMDAIAFGYEEIGGEDGFRKYEHLSIGARALLGEISPLDATVLTMSNLARYYTLTKYYQNLRAEGEGLFLFRGDDATRPEDFNRKIPGVDRGPDGTISDVTSEALSPLAGLYTTDEIYNMMTNFAEFSSTEYSGVAKVLHGFTGLTNVWKTLWAPFTQTRNVMTNTDIVIRNGWANPISVVLAFGYVPADTAYRIISGGKRISSKDKGILAELKQMSDAFQAAIYHNFGNPKWASSWHMGSNVAFKMDMKDYGFDATIAADAATFSSMRKEMEAAMKVQEPRSTIVARMVGTYGVTEDNARKMYADLQGKTFQDTMTEVAGRLANSGVLGTNVNLRVIQEHFKRVSDRDEATAYIANHLFFEESNRFFKMVKWAEKTGKDVSSWPGEAYSFGDDLFKTFGYLRERANYADIIFGKPYYLLDDTQQAEVDNITIEIVKNTIHNYDRIGRFGKFLSNDLFLAQFIAFRIESMRIAVNQIGLAKKEIADGIKNGNNKMRNSGAKRLVGNALMFGTNRAKEYAIASAMYHGAGAVLDGVGSFLGLFEDEDDKEREVKKLFRSWLPEHMKEDHIIPVGFSGPEEGRVTVFPMSANSPFGDFQRALVAADLELDGLDDVGQAAFMAAYTLVGGFKDPKISVAVLAEIVANQDVYGNKIYVESTTDYQGDTEREKFAKIFSYAARRAGPGFISQFGRLGAWDDMLPDTEYWNKFKKPKHAGDFWTELLGGLTGYRPFVIDIYDNFYKRLDTYYTSFGEEGTQSVIYRQVKPKDEKITHKEFEGRLKEMIEDEYNTLKNLHDAYRLPVKHGLVTEERMLSKLLNKPGDEDPGVGVTIDFRKSGGRSGAMIVKGDYRVPGETINKMTDKRRSVFPDYEVSDETMKWINDFQAKKQAELEALKLK